MSLKVKRPWLTAFIAAFALAIFLTSRFYTFGFTVEECLPYKVWLIKKGEPVSRFDYVAFKAKGIPYKKDGRIWIKITEGIKGDKVEISRFTEPVMKAVDLNGLSVERPVIGEVTLRRTDGTFTIMPCWGRTVATNEPLNMTTYEGAISEGHIFVWSPAERSYDSRYWGLVNEENIIGRAHPLW